MDAAQNLTDEFKTIDSAVRVENKRRAVEIAPDPRWALWIDYRALSGTIIEFNERTNSESIRKMTVQEFADKVGVTRETLYSWERNIPGFWDKVRSRKKDLSSQKRLSFMEDKFYLKAMKWDNPQISLAWMEQNNPDWKSSKIKHEHEAKTGWAELFQAHGDAIEGEVVDAKPADNA